MIKWLKQEMNAGMHSLMFTNMPYNQSNDILTTTKIAGQGDRFYQSSIDCCSFIELN